VTRVGVDARAHALGVLGALIPPGTRCALLDFPRHANVGDSAIWLGERALLDDLGVELAYVADRDTFSPEQLAARIPPGTGTILLHGGGNLGDLWPHAQAHREAVIKAFPGHRIIQLPQSMRFLDSANLDRARAVLDAHPDLTLLMRDRAGLRAARAAFRAPSLLCPDSAQTLPDLSTNTAPRHHVLWLARTDHEAEERWPTEGGPHVLRTDWNARQGADPEWSARMAEAERNLDAASFESGRAWTDRSVADLVVACDRYATLHLQRGCRLLESARVVITDRLHGHLLCRLVGRPSVILDDRHGKLGDYRVTWPDNDRPSAATLCEALRAAQHLAGTGTFGPRVVCSAITA